MIRVGIGGWTYEPWRDSFYPEGWSQSRELEYASRALRVIEVNGTYYSSQKPATFAKWRDETPENFVFSLKASRFATNRRVLAEAGESVQRFCTSGQRSSGCSSSSSERIRRSSAFTSAKKTCYEIGRAHV